MSDLAEIKARLARIERLLILTLGGEAIQPDERLALALAEAAPGWFTAGEAWRLAQAIGAAAAATGDPEPPLSAALRAAGITSPHGLGRWLAAHEGQGFERGGVERGGVQWRPVVSAN